VGWATRNPPPWLLRVLRQRDRRCVFPGCELRRFIHAHHIVRWLRGPTNLDLLVLVCPYHHKLVHEGGWRVELAKTGSATWFRPDGRPFRPSAGPRPQLDRGPPDAA
jgi:hypothetical protein